MVSRCAFLVAIMGLWTGAGFGQNTAGRGAAASTGLRVFASFTANTGMASFPVVVGAPYAGELTVENVETLADGTRLTHSAPTQRAYRDSLGRTRSEREIGAAAPNGPQMPVVAEIWDPIIGVAYILDEQGKIAHRVAMKPQPGRGLGPALPTRASTRIAPSGAQIQTQPLGTQMMEGLLVNGTRTTTTFPTGFQGSDRPLVSVQEEWRSPDLGLTVLDKATDPLHGETTRRLTNINRFEQDIALFQPPADYAIVDDAGPSVTIQYRSQ